MSSLLDLDDFILLNIFSFLDLVDLISSSLVCATFHRISNDFYLWRSFCSLLGISHQVLTYLSLSTTNLAWKELFKIIYASPTVTLETKRYPNLNPKNTFSSFAEAISKAQRGDYIFLFPGIHIVKSMNSRFDVLISKMIAIIGLGDSPKDTHLVNSDDIGTLRNWCTLEFGSIDNCYFCQKAATSICLLCKDFLFCQECSQKPHTCNFRNPLYKEEDLLLKNFSLFNTAMSHAICIGNISKMRIEDIFFNNYDSTNNENSVGATTVNIYGTGTFPKLNRICVNGAAKHGVFVGEGANAQIENSEIYNTQHSGIHVTSEGTLTILNSKIGHNKHHGIYVNVSGTAKIENCEIFDTRGEAIKKETETNVTEKNIKKWGNKQEEVGLTTAARDTCTIF